LRHDVTKRSFREHARSRKFARVLASVNHPIDGSLKQKRLSISTHNQRTHRDDTSIRNYFFANSIYKKISDRCDQRPSSDRKGYGVSNSPLNFSQHTPNLTKKVVRVADAFKCSTFRSTGSRSTLKSQTWFDEDVEEDMIFFRRNRLANKNVSLSHLETSQLRIKRRPRFTKKNLETSTHNQPTCLETRQTSHRVEPFRNFFSGSEFF
jgi:hypothetical protein